jgi:hypothetical protein
MVNNEGGQGNSVPEGSVGTVLQEDSLPYIDWGYPLGTIPAAEFRLEIVRTAEPSPVKISSFNQGTNTMSVTSTIKRLALKATNPNEVAKRDAGLHDDCGNLTDAGRDALLGILETQVDTQFTQLANDINAENQAQSK